MYPGNFVSSTPDKPAIIRPFTSEQITYRELEERSRKLAHFLRAAGLKPGDHVAIVSDNDIRVLEIYWAVIRSGMYYTAVNWQLTPEEAAFVIDDCSARALFTSANAVKAVGGEMPSVVHRVVFGGAVEGFDDYEAVIAAQPDAPLTDQPRGQDMLYSSGTTGRPKGIKPPLPDGQVDEIPDSITEAFAPLFGFDADTVYLCPAPLYHAAPLRYCGMVNSVGGTLVLMDHFDAETSLRLIAEYKVTHSQWVPTMFVRMLKLPDEVRAKYDMSSMRCAIHAAAPCPSEVKRQMIEWWGPVINEYYSSTESAGATLINSADALARPGSVGRSVLGPVHICGEDNEELPIGEIGIVYFERDQMPFAYHNDPEKTAAALHPEHPNWSNSGDVGYVDEGGFLYLTDRASFMIISGGVNIYPQETEDALILHPKVLDVAVIGVPDEEMGESVKAVVQLAPGVEPTDNVAAELMEYVRGKVAHYKAPRTLDFAEDLPRTPTGKLIKRQLKARYAAM